MKVNSIQNNNRNTMVFGSAKVKQNQFILDLITETVKLEGIEGANRISRALDRLNNVSHNHTLVLKAEEPATYPSYRRPMVLANLTTGNKVYNRSSADVYFCRPGADSYRDEYISHYPSDYEIYNEKRIVMLDQCRHSSKRSSYFVDLVDAAINCKEFWEETPVFKMIDDVFNKCVK